MGSRVDYRFDRLCGRSFTGGDVVFAADGDVLLSPVGNRVNVIDLAQHRSTTMDVQATHNIVCMDLAPNNNTLIIVDEDSKALIVSYHRQVILSRFSFKGPVTAIKFSPDNKYVAVGVGSNLCIYEAPPLVRAFNALILHRRFAGPHDQIVSIAWSPDSQRIAAGSKDQTMRVYTLHPTAGFSRLNCSGHRDTVIGVFFRSNTSVWSVARDGAVYEWELFLSPRTSQWQARLQQKHIFEPTSAVAHLSKVLCVTFHRQRNLVVAGFNTGVFAVHDLSNEFPAIHSLSVSAEKITSVCMNASGDWIAFGSPKLGQVLVWEWQSESFILKQQGHLNANGGGQTVCYSPKGDVFVSGGLDGKVKVWNPDNGFCFATFADHTAAVTSLAFASRGSVILSASLDGTVRAYDLTRYRNFRTLTPPAPSQLLSLAVDASGDIVCAGARDPFCIYVWSLRTGKLLDTLSGHQGPVTSLGFNPVRNLLLSGSWDATVKVWDVFSNKVATESFQHASDVVALAVSQSSPLVAAATLDGQVSFWNTDEGRQIGVLEVKHDLRAGRKSTDARAAGAAIITSLSLSPDGNLVFVGGDSRHVCVYSVMSHVLLQRFQLSANQSLEGVKEKLHSRLMTEAGPLADIDDDPDQAFDLDDELADRKRLPGVQTGDLSSRRFRPTMRCTAVAVCPTGQRWMACTTEGILQYCLEDAVYFDPIDLTEDVTPDACVATALKGRFDIALLMALRLNTASLIQQVMEAVPMADIPALVQSIPAPYAIPLLRHTLALVSLSPYLERTLRWSQALLLVHNTHLRQHKAQASALLIALRKAIVLLYSHLGSMTRANLDRLAFVVHQ